MLILVNPYAICLALNAGEFVFLIILNIVFNSLNILQMILEHLFLLFFKITKIKLELQIKGFQNKSLQFSFSQLPQ